jgi:hypothetical protein
VGHEPANPRDHARTSSDLPLTILAEMWFNRFNMGQDSAAVQVLDTATLDGVASYIKSGKARKIVIMVRPRFSQSPF